MWHTEADFQKDLAAGAEKTREGSRSPLQACCANLAQMGCIAFQWDLVGYCDSKPIKHQEGFTDPEAVQRCQSFMGLQTWNSIRTLDFVTSLPDVDPSRIACTGASSGGTQTIQLSVTEKDRLAGVFPAVMVSMNMQGGCVCENEPLLRVLTDNVELASLFAPKPQAAAAANDWTVDFETRGLPEMKKIYGFYNEAENISGKHFDFPHNCNLSSRELMYNFMNKALHLGLAEPVGEKSFEPIPPEQLSVWDKDHVLPADAADAKTLRAGMSKISDEQLTDLFRSNRAAYLSTLHAALEILVVDQMPSPSDVVATRQDRSNDKAFTWRGYLARKNSGERISCEVVTPSKPDGTLVIWADPRGTAVLDDADDRAATPLHSLASGNAILMAIDPFLLDTLKPTHPLPPPAARLGYSAYSNGYERTTLANRTHDLLTAMAYAQSLPGVKKIRILATPGAAPQALLATALAGGVIDKGALDLAEFDFSQVTTNDDPNLLPGSLKYGNISAFLALAASHAKLLVTNPSTNTELPEAANLTATPSPAKPVELASWLLAS
jgi:hypothetical protein